MSRPHTIEIHPDRRVIELLLAADVSLNTIHAQFDVPKSTASRYRRRMRTANRRFFVDLRRAAAAAGITRRTYRFTPVTLSES